jgi:hypothetical protein
MLGALSEREMLPKKIKEERYDEDYYYHEERL